MLSPSLQRPVQVLLNGQILPWTGEVQEVLAPIYEPGSDKKVCIGYQARFTEEDSLKALDAATKSWDAGKGAWAQATPEVRIAKVDVRRDPRPTRPPGGPSRGGRRSI